MVNIQYFLPSISDSTASVIQPASVTNNIPFVALISLYVRTNTSKLPFTFRFWNSPVPSG